MATIEPRLIHLLNNASPSREPPLDLPPIQTLSFPSSSHSVSLPPLDIDPALRNDYPHPTIPPFSSLTGEDGTAFGHTKDVHYHEPAGVRYKNPNHSLSHILDDTPEPTEDPSQKKRHRALTGKDELIQLPQPLKKQKSSQQVMPPIINGLHEPPPNAAMFPPISSAEFDDEDSRQNPLPHESTVVFPTEGPGTSYEYDKEHGVKLKRKAVKPRRKWTDEETNHLLLGVSRHGVGKWTIILDDPDFKFNERSAGDLKDRFRTCCPDELRGKLDKKGRALLAPSATEPKLRTKSSLPLEDILAADTDPDEKESGSSASVPPSAAAPPLHEVLWPKPQRKSRAHRKKMEDLVELGIRGPFKKASRRERRPFTEQDDKEILEGLDLYGPAWTKIQRDPKFSLQSRQPTDLRDRVRNKYPEIYARIEKGGFQEKGAKGNGLLEPSVNTSIENSMIGNKPTLEPSLNRSNSKDNMPKWPRTSSFMDAAESPFRPPPTDPNEPPTSSLGNNAGEMDISRLLLD